MVVSSSTTKKTLVIVAAVALLALLAVYVRGGGSREGYSKRNAAKWTPAPPPLDTLQVPLLPIFSEYGGRYVALPGKGENAKLGTKSQMVWDKVGNKAYWYRTGGTFGPGGGARPPRVTENTSVWTNVAA